MSNDKPKKVKRKFPVSSVPTPLRAKIAGAMNYHAAKDRAILKPLPPAEIVLSEEGRFLPEPETEATDHAEDIARMGQGPPS